MGPIFSDPTNMPHLRCVLSEVRGSSSEILHAFGKVFGDRGVAFKRVTNDYSSFVPIKPLE